MVCIGDRAGEGACGAGGTGMVVYWVGDEVGSSMMESILVVMLGWWYICGRLRFRRACMGP